VHLSEQFQSNFHTHLRERFRDTCDVYNMGYFGDSSVCKNGTVKSFLVLMLRLDVFRVCPVPLEVLERLARPEKE